MPAGLEQVSQPFYGNQMLYIIQTIYLFTRNNFFTSCQDYVDACKIYLTTRITNHY